MFEDPIVDEIRKNRDKIAAEYNHDIHKLFVHWRELETTHQDQVVTILPKNQGRNSLDPDITV